MRRFLWFLGFLATLGVGFVLALIVVAVWKSDGGLAVGERIGVVVLRGFIGDPQQTVEALRDFREEDEVKAVILRVESPGGAIAPSQEIHDEVKRTAAAKPLVVSMGAVAASGGYYVSAPATRIVANPGTVTGSIGVILQTQEIHALFDRLGLRPRVLKSGPLKDAGSPFREMTDADRTLLQGIVDDMFDQFVEAVAEGRGMDREDVLALADGRVYSGRQARDHGLVDQLGGFWEAVEVARDEAGLARPPKLEYRKRERRSLLRWVLGDDAQALDGLEALGSFPLRYVLPDW
jgi:protease-4